MEINLHQMSLTTVMTICSMVLHCLFISQRNQTLPPVDIKHFLNTVEQLNDKFALYLNTSSTGFGMNMTEFQILLEKEVALLPSTTNPLMMTRYRTPHSDSIFISNLENISIRSYNKVKRKWPRRSLNILLLDRNFFLDVVPVIYFQLG